MSVIWKNCLAKLENEISSSDFSTWIRPLQADESSDQLKLLAPNRFVIDWVKEHYLSNIEDAVYEFSSGNLTLALEIGSKAVKAAVSAPDIQQKPALKNKVHSNYINRAFTFSNFILPYYRKGSI